jgi:hypothetical protein
MSNKQMNSPTNKNVSNPVPLRNPLASIQKPKPIPNKITEGAHKPKRIPTVRTDGN